MPRKFTVVEPSSVSWHKQETRYEGFDRDFTPSKLDTVLIYTEDGELELLALDPIPAGKTIPPGVMKYLESLDGVVQIIGLYNRR